MHIRLIYWLLILIFKTNEFRMKSHRTALVARSVHNSMELLRFVRVSINFTHARYLWLEIRAAVNQSGRQAGRQLFIHSTTSVQGTNNNIRLPFFHKWPSSNSIRFPFNWFEIIWLYGKYHLNWKCTSKFSNVSSFLFRSLLALLNNSSGGTSR